MTSPVVAMPRRRYARRARGWKNARRFVLPIAGLGVMAFFLWPYIVMLFDALRPSGEVLATPPTFFPKTWTGSAFVQVITDPAFQNWLKTSLIVAVCATVIVMVVAIPAAYFTARFSFRGRMIFLGLVVVTQMFAPTSLVVGIYREFYDLGLVNSYTALILTDAAFNIAFALWILQGFFAAIPKDVEEAAELDGCGRLGTLFRIMLPLTLPGLVTAVTFTFIAAWNEYVVALTLIQDDALKPLTVGINSYVTAYQQNWSQLFAASLIAIVPVVILFALIEKHLVGGMTAGAIK
ncbi:MAG: multiple sugar transport system permease protein [Microbacteriaceae bacterium]|jgi:multiple sugar transport system permease protein|nr:Carbohydrate transporter rane protein 2, family [Microbacteriaceae bacterium]MCU1580779.1 Carbohydrate transporter rane protein 2, family [Microbacteriaceae bacterium]MDQ1526205.1 multiple sugar transport system permease protein [Microbacteriaceae bacterium]MDQ1549046.1 multiple sugar transport system permease protein [Microbacteriaceae bacterium]